MTHLRRAAAPAYVVAALLILFPILDLAQAIWPPRLGEFGWRVLTAGLVSRIMLTPILGLFLAYAAALVAGQERVLKIMAVANAAVAILILAGLSLFALDALQMRTQVGPDARDNYDLGLLISFGKFGAAVLFLGFLSISEWKSGAKIGRGADRKSSATPLVIRKSTHRAAASQPEPTARSES